MNKRQSLRARIALALLAMGSAIFLPSWATELRPGDRYEIIRPMYLMAVYDSLNNRKLSRETARAYLDPDPAQGLDVILELNRGIEGNLDGLNPELFRKTSIEQTEAHQE